MTVVATPLERLSKTHCYFSADFVPFQQDQLHELTAQSAGRAIIDFNVPQKQLQVPLVEGTGFMTKPDARNAHTELSV